MHTEFVREVTVSYTGPRRKSVTIQSDRDAAHFIRKMLGNTMPNREHFGVLLLDARHRVIGHQVVSIGTATASLVHPREVFQPAIAIGAVSVILFHTHPSGDASPSNEDCELTKRLTRAGTLLSIPILDHIVLGDPEHYSFKTNGLL